jgi:hypothetical protein
MQKAERDALITHMSAEERQTYFGIIQDWRARILAATDTPVTVRQLFNALAEDLPSALRQALAATAERDAMGPRVGELPPDFTLKRLGVDEAVTLSGFRGHRPVALVFGSYT